MSHYKINERKCSTTFFPFDFIFLFHTAGGDGEEAVASSAQNNHSSPFPVPGGASPPPLGPAPPLTSDFLFPESHLSLSG